MRFYVSNFRKQKSLYQNLQVLTRITVVFLFWSQTKITNSLCDILRTAVRSKTCLQQTLQTWFKSLTLDSNSSFENAHLRNLHHKMVTKCPSLWYFWEMLILWGTLWRFRMRPQNDTPLRHRLWLATMATPSGQKRQQRQSVLSSPTLLPVASQTCQK